MAEELGADTMAAKQGALLHDIGKALDQDMEGTHVEIGRKIAEKFDSGPENSQTPSFLTMAMKNITRLNQL